MKYYVDPNKYPEWYSSQYTEEDRKIIKEICKKTEDDILRRQGR